jgi:hypothetical protein
MLNTIPHETNSIFLGDKTIYLSKNLGASHLLWFRVCHYDTFRKVLNVSSECMVRRVELSMFVERGKLATTLQPNEL